MTDQWPIVGRSDLYYGGTTYGNKQGLGVQLALATASSPAVKAEKSKGALHPSDDKWLAVPITRLYDLGLTVRTSELLLPHIGEASLLLNPVSAAETRPGWAGRGHGQRRGGQTQSHPR